MRALVRAELIKVTSTRTPVLLLLATLGLAILTITVTVPKVGDANAPLSLDDPSLLAAVVGNSFGAPVVLVVLLGVLAFTQEFRYGTATSTYLGEPRRSRVLVAKLLSLVIVSVVVSIATLALSIPVSTALIGSRGGETAVAGQFWETVAAALAFMVAYGAIGVAVGALVRHQIAAVVGVLVWMLLVEQIVIPAFPEVGRWMPWGAAAAFLQLGPSIQLDGQLLSAPAGGLVLIGYTAAAVTLAARITPRRDVL